MRLNKFFMLGLAGLAFAACSNDEGLPEVQNGEKQAVVLKISTASEARALGDSQAGLGGQENTPNDGQTIKLSKVTIFYAANGSVVKSVSLDATKDTQKWADLTTGAGYVEHNLPAAVNDVFVAGNLNGDLSKVATKTALEAMVVNASDQQDVNNIVLYGVGTPLQAATQQEHQVGQEKHTKLMETTVDLKPLISRIEISGIQCEDLGNQYSSVDLKAIGLMNVWQQVQVGGTTTGEELTLTNVAEPGTTGKTFVFGSSNFWAWDSFNPVVSLSTSTDVAPSTKQVYGYNFIAKNENDLQVKLYVAAKKGEVVNPINNTVTALFKGKTFEPGRIYKVQLKFKEENIGPWNPEEIQCIQVKVTVQKWEVETLTPTYQ